MQLYHNGLKKLPSDHSPFFLNLAHQKLTTESIKKNNNKQTNNCDKIIIYLLGQKQLSLISDVSLYPFSFILRYHHSHGDPRRHRLKFVTNEQMSEN